jgi:hypothetical protein
VSDIEVVHEIEEVSYTELHRRDVRVQLINRPDVSHGHLGKSGQSWVPTWLDLRYEKRDDQPWTVKANLTVHLRLKSGGVSERVSRDGIGFEIDGDWRKRPYGFGWPNIELPDYVPGIVEAHAPEGWQPC